MKTLKLGLVTEGKTDQVVLRELLTAVVKRRGEALTLEFRDLQPTADRTSEGGLEMVYKWCLNNPPEERANRFQRDGLFAGLSQNNSFDAIIIHLDGDSCDHPRISMLMPDSAIPLPDASATDRGDFVERTLNHWLWTLHPTWDGIKDLRQIPAPAVEMTETWLVAGLCEDFAPEESKEILRRLVELDFSLKNKVAPKDAKQVKKERENYRRLSMAAANQIDRILSCYYFNQLVSRILMLASC
ncbi:putative DUF4276 family protein [uncultured Gammaproteobacteria bacterium]